MINTGMGKTLLVALAFSIIMPVILMFLSRFRGLKRISRVTVLIIYVFGILYLTLIDRKVGENGQVNLTPFWTYRFFSKAQYRWQIYLNILLFIPLGFLLPWLFERGFLFVIITGFLFSAIIEFNQLVFELGLCEVDDVIHNTSGAAIGYGYWMILDRIDHMHNTKRRQS